MRCDGDGVVVIVIVDSEGEVRNKGIFQIFKYRGIVGYLARFHQVGISRGPPRYSTQMVQQHSLGRSLAWKIELK